MLRFEYFSFLTNKKKMNYSLEDPAYNMCNCLASVQSCCYVLLYYLYIESNDKSLQFKRRFKARVTKVLLSCQTMSKNVKSMV